jgi:hypothetical protein
MKVTFNAWSAGLCTLVCLGQELKPTFQPGCKPFIELCCLTHITCKALFWGTWARNDRRCMCNNELSIVFSSFKQTQQSAELQSTILKLITTPIDVYNNNVTPKERHKE